MRSNHSSNSFDSQIKLPIVYNSLEGATSLNKAEAEQRVRLVSSQKAETFK